MAILKLFFILSLIVLAFRRNVSFGNAFIGAAFLLPFLYGMPLNKVVQSFINSCLAPHTMSLTALVMLLLVLSIAMKESGNLQAMLELVRVSIKSERLRLIFFPLIIGWLPMPGGAIFSAPIVKELSKRKYTPEQMTFINYWYRHIWEYCWPLYPGILLLTALSNVTMVEFSLMTMPLTLFAFVFGLFYLPKSNNKTKQKVSYSICLKFLKHLLPILIAIIPALFLGNFVAFLLPECPVTREIGLAGSIICSLFYLVCTSNYKLSLSVFCDKHVLNMGYTAFGVMVFKGMLEFSQAILQISIELTTYHIPLVLICMLLPFLAGLVTGITIGFVGTSFPLIISLLKASIPEEQLLSYLMLSLVFGFVGTLFSPLHICLVLSTQYFQAKLKDIYCTIYLPCLGMLIVGYIYFLFLTL